MRPLKLLIADDHALMIEAVKLAVENEPDFEIVGEAESGSQVLPLVQQTSPDLVVLDLVLPGVDGLTCIGLLRERFADVKIAVLSALDDDETVESALRLGASAFISKNVEPQLLAQALRQAAEGEVGEPIGRAGKRANPAVEEKGLTMRELAVLRALGEGHSNKQIARALWLAEQTVKFHLTNIYRKLDVDSRTEAVHWAYRHGLLETPIVRTTLQSE
jgi:DNA-binding NarL/FixJ family response regulator